VWHQDSGAPGSDRDSTPATKVTPQAHRLHLQARPTWPRAVKNAATRCRESLCIFAKARHLKRQSSTRLTMAGLALGEWTRAAVAAGACFSGCQRQDQRFLSTGLPHTNRHCLAVAARQHSNLLPPHKSIGPGSFLPSQSFPGCLPASVWRCVVKAPTNVVQLMLEPKHTRTVSDVARQGTAASQWCAF
jgi:hypothetical protein